MKIKLNDLLKNRNITVSSLSKQTGISRSTVSQLANTNDLPSKTKMDTLIKIAKSLNISFNELVYSDKFDFDFFKITPLNLRNNNYFFGIYEIEVKTEFENFIVPFIYEGLLTFNKDVNFSYSEELNNVEKTCRKKSQVKFPEDYKRAEKKVIDDPLTDDPWVYLMFEDDLFKKNHRKFIKEFEKNEANVRKKFEAKHDYLVKSFVFNYVDSELYNYTHQITENFSNMSNYNFSKIKTFMHQISKNNLQKIYTLFTNNFNDYKIDTSNLSVEFTRTKASYERTIVVETDSQRKANKEINSYFSVDPVIKLLVNKLYESLPTTETNF